MSDKASYLKQWLYRANEDIIVINRLLDHEPQFVTSTICFHAQQAVEKYLKAFLVLHDVHFPKTHDVDYLLKECQKIDREMFLLDLESLTDFGVSVRYPDDFLIPELEDAKKYGSIANEIKKLVEKELHKHL